MEKPTGSGGRRGREGLSTASFQCHGEIAEMEKRADVRGYSTFRHLSESVKETERAGEDIVRVVDEESIQIQVQPRPGARERLPRCRSDWALEHMPLKHQCEVLYAQGRINDAVQSLVQITNTASESVIADKLVADWLTGESLSRITIEYQFVSPEFTHRCVSALERIGNEALDIQKHDEAIAAYSTALSLSHSTSNTVLIKWARAMLIRGSGSKALGAAAKVCFPW